MTTYEIFHEIGRGSFSTVCKCVNKDTGKECAVKIVPKKNLRNKSDLEGFQREINSLSLLQHPNIVSMTDFFSDDDNFYIITDICEGGQLFKHLKKFGKFPEELALEIFQQIVSALLYIHQAGVAHRDLKPQNILVGKFPEVKVADFGLCDYIDDRKDENLEKKIHVDRHVIAHLSVFSILAKTFRNVIFGVWELFCTPWLLEIFHGMSTITQ